MAADLPFGTSYTVRRAWVVLITAFSLFSLLVVSAGTGVYLYRSQATQPYDAELEISGEVLLQPHNETRFKQVRNGERVREGDTISTQTSGQARLIFFDGSELRLAQATSVQVNEMRATRFVADEKRIALTQQKGWSRLTAAPATRYGAGRFRMVLDSLEVETATQPQAGADLIFELRPLEQLPTDALESGPMEATVVVRDGTAAVRAAGAEVQLDEGQKTTAVRVARSVTPPAPPSAATREYIRNGDFQELTPVTGSTGWPRQWVETFFGNQPGDALLDYRVDGTTKPVVLLRRRVGATEHAVTGIRQDVNLPLGHFRQLRLRVVLQINYQSLSGGGIADSEYPVIVKLTYRDRQNVAHTWYRGFYMHNRENLRVASGIPVRPGEWYTFEQDLLQLNTFPPPIFLETIDIQAAGHDFEAAIASVSIQGD